MNCPVVEDILSEEDRFALMIDGANLYQAARALGFDIDYRKLLSSFQKRGYLLRAYYYTALVEDQEYSSIRPLIDWLDYNGFKVVTKPAKEFTDSTGRRKIKGNMDIELTVDDGPRTAMALLRTLDAGNVVPTGLTVREPSLDDVFLALTGHKAEAEATDGDRSERGAA